MTEMQNLSVNVNEAAADELITIRGIGKSIAQRIIENRPYKELHDLVAVPGINEIKLASLTPYLMIEKTRKKESRAQTPSDKGKVEPEETPQFGETEAFIILEDNKERQEAMLIIFGGFILGLIIFLLRRKNR